MSGDEFAACVKEKAPITPVVMLTGFGDMMDAAGEKPQHVDAVLSKPITADKHRQAIQEAIHNEPTGETGA